MLYNTFTVILFSFFISAIVKAEVSDVHQQTSTPTNARYEIVQSEIAAKWTFRLDRYLGKVRQLVKLNNGGTGWENMTVYKLPKISKPLKPRFHLFTSGIASRHTYLMDSVTGQTWVMVGETVPVLPLGSGETRKVISWESFGEW